MKKAVLVLACAAGLLSSGCGFLGLNLHEWAIHLDEAVNLWASLNQLGYV